jgi:hypothetical protein
VQFFWTTTHFLALQLGLMDGKTEGGGNVKTEGGGNVPRGLNQIVARRFGI